MDTPAFTRRTLDCDRRRRSRGMSRDGARVIFGSDLAMGHLHDGPPRDTLPAPETRHEAPASLFLERGRNRRPRTSRSEEHTSELQSLMRISYAVFCLKKKKKKNKTYNNKAIKRYDKSIKTPQKTNTNTNHTKRQK